MFVVTEEEPALAEHFALPEEIFVFWRKRF